MSKITVIGSMNMDVVANMERFPLPGETVSGTDVNYFFGGKGANQCVSIARLNGDVEMVGCVGNDNSGKDYLALLEQENIRHDNVFVKDISTGTAIIQIDKKGQNTIAVIPGANFAFDFECLEKIKPVIDQTEYVVLQMEMRMDVTEEIIRYAHKQGKTVILNPAPVHPISDEVLGMVDILTPNETELALLSGENDFEAGCRKLLSLGVRHIVATLGHLGAMHADNNGTETVPAFHVTPVDTVAAGDSFNGALVVALSEGKSFSEAILFANAMGALTVQGKGAIPSLQRREKVDAFLKEHAKQ